MSASGKGLLGVWLCRIGDNEWTVKSDSETLPKTNHAIEKQLSMELESKDLNPPEKTSLVITIRNRVGCLSRALQVFQDLGINVLHMHFEKKGPLQRTADVAVDIECDPKLLQKVMGMLKREVDSVNIAPTGSAQELSEANKDDNVPFTPISTVSFDFGDMIWFPRHISDLDKIQNVLMHGSALDADHPGFTDPEYLKRRNYFAEVAQAYRYDKPIPRIQYTSQEIKTWGVVFNELHKLYLVHAVPEYLENWPQLVKYCGYREDNLPQLQDVSNFLKRKTGFTVRPVAGYLSPRDFLAGLAFRVFHCTQYIRHHSDPFYTPEPDCCHELLGHMPLLANNSFAQFSQEIGLASLGASEEDVSKLATLYFFTVEFGLCRQLDGTFKVYGAGLLSSVAELTHAVTAHDKIKQFDPDVTCKEECIITAYQNAYYYTNSFEEAKDKMRAFAESIYRPFALRYNAYTQSVEVLHSAKKICDLATELKGDLTNVSSALRKVSATDINLNVEEIAQMLASAFPVRDNSPSPESTDKLFDDATKNLHATPNRRRKSITINVPSNEKK